MANTIKTYVSDGVRTSYPVDFTLGYLNDRNLVYVYQGEDPNVQLGYTWTDDFNINLDAPVPNGESFNIRRIVPRDKLVNDYVDGAQIRERNLDQSYSQALMIIEELEDGFIAVIPPWVINGDLTVKGSITADQILNEFGQDYYALAAQAVTDAQAAQAAAEAAQVAAEAAEVATKLLYDDFNDRYYGPLPSDPATAPSGAPSTEGDLYFNTTALSMRVFDGAVWDGLAVAQAVDVAYDNTVSGLTALNVQDAIDELVATPGGVNWEGNTKTASFTAADSNGYPVSGSGAFTTTVTLPPLQEDGLVVVLADGTGEWNTKPIRVQTDNPLIEKIDGVLADLDLAFKDGYVQLISHLADNNWRVIVNNVAPQNIVEDSFAAGAGPWVLSQTPPSKESINVYVGNVWQDKNAYELVGDNLSITGGASGAVRVRHNGFQLPIATPADNTVTTTKLVNDAVTVDKLDTNLRSRAVFAYCNFDGTGVAAIRESYNISSLVDVGTGIYVENFVTNSRAVNFTAVHTTANRQNCYDIFHNRSVASCQVNNEDADTLALIDSNGVNTVIFELE